MAGRLLSRRTLLVRGLLLPRVGRLLLVPGLLVGRLLRGGRLLLVVRGLLLVGRLVGVAEGLPCRTGLGLASPVGRVRAVPCLACAPLGDQCSPEAASAGTGAGSAVTASAN